MEEKNNKIEPDLNEHRIRLRFYLILSDCSFIDLMHMKKPKIRKDSFIAVF